MAAAPDQQPVHVTELREVRDVRVYKVVVGGSDASLATYNEQCLAAGPRRHSAEWRAMYTQFKRQHALGTVPYRWEREDCREATLVEATFASLDVVVLDGPMMHESHVGGDQKAAAAKAELGIDASLPLMAALGERGQAALVRETPDEWELVVPHKLLRRLSPRERAVGRFRRHARLPITGGWLLEGREAWEAWEDGATLEDIPDLPMDWLPPEASTCA